MDKIKFREYLKKKRNVLFLETTIGEKNNWDLPFCHKKNSRKDFASLKVTKSFSDSMKKTSDSMLWQVWKTIPGNTDYEKAIKLEINIKLEGRGCDSHNFCHWLSWKLKTFWKGFCKDPENIFLKSALSLRGDCTDMFNMFLKPSQIWNKNI